MTAIAPPFALTLLKWIRANKKALYASNLPQVGSKHPLPSRHQSDLDLYRTLKNKLASFETQYRGAQKWLAGVDAPTYFAGTANRYLLSVVNHVLGMQACLQDSPDEAFNTLWKSFFDLAGMSDRMFSDLAATHIGHDRLPALASHFPHAQANYTYEHLLEIEFNNGFASNKLNKQYALPAVLNLTLGEQISALNQYWAGIREFARAELKNTKNWPTDASSESIEKRRVIDLAEKLVKGITAENLTLVKKHQDLFRGVLNKHF